MKICMNTDFDLKGCGQIKPHFHQFTLSVEKAALHRIISPVYAASLKKSHVKELELEAFDGKDSDHSQGYNSLLGNTAGLLGALVRYRVTSPVLFFQVCPRGRRSKCGKVTD